MPEQPSLLQTLGRIERTISSWLALRSMGLLRCSLGIVFLGFGVLKFIPGASPAAGLVTRVLSTVSFGIIPDSTGLILIALLETAIGLSLLSGRFLRVGLALLAVATIGTLAPLVLFPQDLLTSSFTPTLEGQYVFKDVVLLFAGLLVALWERGARLVLDFDEVTHQPVTRADGSGGTASSDENDTRVHR